MKLGGGTSRWKPKHNYEKTGSPRCYLPKVDGIRLIRRLQGAGNRSKAIFEYCFDELAPEDESDSDYKLVVSGALFSSRRHLMYSDSDWMVLDKMLANMEVQSSEEKEVLLGGMMAFDLAMGYGIRAAEVLKKSDKQPKRDQKRR